MSGAAAAVAAQAKVNLVLHVLAREASGYHQVETLICRLDLADDVVVRVTSGGRTIDCVGAETGPADTNLAYRAGLAYADNRRWPSGFSIEVVTHIPVGGGLGGGSADAGAVLRALWALDPAPPPLAALLAWGSALGADVPALTIDQSLVLAWGRGERLLPLPPLPPRDALLYVPDAGLSTRDAYAWLAATRAEPDGARAPCSPPGRVLDLPALAQWDTVAQLMANDFEAVVGPRRPEIAAMIARMRALTTAYASVMSGSGSTVCCVLRDGAMPPWTADAATGGRWVATRTADRVVGVRLIE